MKKEGRKTLLLDTGNLFFRKPPQTETKRRDALLRVDLLIHSYNQMGYDVVNVGEKDLMMGIKFLSEVSPKAKFSLVSTNLVDKKTGKCVFNPYVIKEVVGLRVAILGLLDDQFNPTLQEKDPGLSIIEPLSALKAAMKGLREYCDFIVVLSQLGESKDKKLARQNRDIDLILGGGGESKRVVMERENGTAIYRLEPRGGYLGRVDYSLSDTKKPIRFMISDEREELEKKFERLISHSIQIKMEMSKSGKQDDIKVKEVKFLESKQKELEKTLSAFEDKNFYKHIAIPVQMTITDDPKITKELETYRSESAKLYKAKVVIEVGKDLSEKEVIARIPKTSPFAGAISCKRCHEVNYRNWLKTKHAKASQTIAASPKYAQEECLMCHSTGYGKMGEYATVSEVPFYLQGVQCEACHGEGKGHPEKGSMERKVTLGICRNCHTKDQSPTFNYIAYLEKIGCRTSQ
jgi:2',3'-cyclic-nucleotide 2'-phosphodiesterase (5'-nucleotidase family)